MRWLTFWRSEAETTLYAELVRRGLPADYARRTADEVDDHRADLIADTRSVDAAEAQAIADERLGEPRQLARKIAGDYRRRSWFGRWPVVSFVLAPVPLWIAAAAAIYAVLHGLTYPAHAVFGFALEGWSPWNRLVGLVACAVSLYAVVFAVVPSILSYRISKLALQATSQRSWALVASCVLAITAASLTYEMDCSLEPGETSFVISSPTVTITRFDPWTTLSDYLRPIALAQMAGPLLACVLVLRSDSDRRRTALDFDGQLDQAASRAA